jgi:hypothetical protein
LGEDDGATGSVREALEHLNCRIGLADRKALAGPPPPVIPLTFGEYRA